MYEDIIEEEQRIHGSIVDLRKQPAVTILNKQKLTKQELDDLFVA